MEADGRGGLRRRLRLDWLPVAFCYPDPSNKPPGVVGGEWTRASACSVHCPGQHAVRIDQHGKRKAAPSPDRARTRSEERRVGQSVDVRGGGHLTSEVRDHEM